MRHPTTNKEVQKFTRMIAALSRFVSQEANRSPPFFNLLKRCRVWMDRRMWIGFNSTQGRAIRTSSTDSTCRRRDQIFILICFWGGPECRNNPRNRRWPATRQLRHQCSSSSHADIPIAPPIEQTSVSSPWLFAWWGIDILGPFPTAPSQVKYLVVAVEYFTKWVEADPLVWITTKNASYDILQKVHYGPVWQSWSSCYWQPHTVRR